MRKLILLAGLIWAMQVSFIFTPAFSEEANLSGKDEGKTKIIEGILDFFSNLTSKDIEGMMKWVSPNYGEFQTDVQKEFKSVENITDISCNQLNILNYDYQEGNKLKVEFTIECSGHDIHTLKNVKRVIAKQISLNKDTSGKWKIVEAKDLDVNKISTK